MVEMQGMCSFHSAIWVCGSRGRKGEKNQMARRDWILIGRDKSGQRTPLEITKLNLLVNFPF